MKLDSQGTTPLETLIFLFEPIRHILALKDLVNSGVVNTYPPLVDITGSYVAQYEHTLILKPSGKEILSKGDDY